MGDGENGREENGKRERKGETNSFPVTGLGCDSFVDREKKKDDLCSHGSSKAEKTCLCPALGLVQL